MSTGLFTREIRRDIEIDAPTPAVWAVISDTETYGKWNPFVRRLSGEPREGAQLEVEIAPPGGRKMTFKPRVVTAEPGRELRWLGRLLFPGLLDGEHGFRVEPLPDGRTRFVQTERFAGVLMPLLKTTLDKTELGFEQMNEALKREVEARAGAAV